MSALHVFVIDTTSWRVTVNGIDVPDLARKEFLLLEALVKANGVAMTREALMAACWPSVAPWATTRTVDVHIGRLRRKLGQAGSAIQTVRGIGFRMVHAGPMKTGDQVTMRCAGVPDGKLSQCEVEVLKLIAEGKTTKEIARELTLSYKTADCHRTNIGRKLKVHSVALLTRYAVRTGLVEA